MRKIKIPVAVLAFALGFLTSSFGFAFSQEVERHIDEVVSVFENSTTEIQYDYIKNLHDGRGYTAGKCGFTTSTRDLLLVVEDYLSRSDDAELKKLIPVLRKRANSDSPSTRGLSKLPRLWKRLSKQAKFKASQDSVCTLVYKNPAHKVFNELKLKTTLAYLILYDSIVQHGDGEEDDDDYYDSLRGILSRVPNWKTEEEFLQSFLDEREKDLLHPQNQATADEWRESVDRVRALRRLLDAKKFDVSKPFTLDVWNESFQIQ